MKNHSLIMILCCLIPVAALVVLLLLGVKWSSALLVGVVLVCPLLHLYSMWGIGSGHGHRA